MFRIRGITSDFINSLFLPNKDEILIGHSQNYSIFNFGTRKVTNVNTTKDGQPFPSPSLNYMMKDSRGILWMASPAGVTMYDEASDSWSQSMTSMERRAR